MVSKSGKLRALVRDLKKSYVESAIHKFPDRNLQHDISSHNIYIYIYIYGSTFKDQEIMMIRISLCNDYKIIFRLLIYYPVVVHMLHLSQLLIPHPASTG